MDGDSAVVAAHGLTKRFGGFTAVDGVSFEIRRGEIFGFLGPNGAGKSTTIRMLCGLLTPSGGAATVAGHDVRHEPAAVKARMGYMSQKFSLYRDLTVRENVEFFGGVYGLRGGRFRDRAAAVLAMGGLAGMEDALAGEMSGAFQQRLALGCAVLHEPSVLFLDEPTSGVDPIARRTFWDLIQNLAARGVTIMVTTHFLDEAQFCGRVGLIDGGRLAALDTPAAVCRDAVPEDVFEVELDEPRMGRERIRRLPGVAACSYFGRRLHVFARRGQYGAASLSGAMAGVGLRALDVRPTAARLEDAFVRLTDREGGASRS
jgi:ABC-2 type transport system ATP-binding protein